MAIESIAFQEYPTGHDDKGVKSVIWSSSLVGKSIKLKCVKQVYQNFGIF